jgi:CRP-like cAMP-binding protein
MTEPPFPEPLDDDDDDVAWALQTAKVQWTRGGQTDALVWLGRAADSADQLGNVWRANDLRRMTADLSASLSAAPGAESPLPQWDAGDDLIGNEESGITSIPPPAMPHAPLSSYAPVDDFEVEDEPQSFEEEIVQEVSVVTDTPHNPIAQLLGTEIELTDEVEMGDEIELTDEVEVIEDAAPDDDVIDDDALSIEAPPYEESADDPVTQPLIDDPRFLDIAQRSPLPPPRSSLAAPRSSLAAPRSSLPPPSSSLPPPRSWIPARPSPSPSPPVPVPVPVPDPHPRFPSPRLPAPAPLRMPPLKATLPGPVPTPAPPPPPEPEGDPEVGGVLLGEVRGLEDVPPEGQAILARDATIERLANEEEVSSFGLALVLRGSVSVMPAIADLSCARATKGEIIWSQGNLEDGVALRLVAAEDSTEVAVWDAELLKSTVRDYPWVVEDLKALADRFQALAGVAMGPMGERLDDSLRGTVTQRCEIKRLLPGETLTTKGQPVGGMYIMAAGRLEIIEGDAVESELGPGDFLFGAQVLSNGKAPHDSRAGKGGALVLFATRTIAHDLLLTVPPLLEIFAS